MDWRGLPVGGGPPEIKRGPKETHSGWPTPYCIIREKQREVESYRQWHRHFFDFVDHEALPDGPFGEKRSLRKSHLWEGFAFVGLTTAVRSVLTPLENFRIHQQAVWGSVVLTRALTIQDVASNLRHWFRGNMLAVSRFIVGVNVLRFVKDAVFPSVLIALPGHTTEPPHFVATGIAAVIGHALFYPFDLLRTHIAVTYQPGVDRSVRSFQHNLLLRLSKEGGMWRGFQVSILGLTAFMSSSLAVYLLCKPFLPSIEDDLNRYSEGVFASAGVATLVGLVVAYPFDTVRRRIMLLGDSIEKYRSVRHYVRHIIKSQGYRALYGGFGVAAVHTSCLLLGMSFVWTRFPNIIYAFEIPDETIVDESREAARVRLDPYASIKPMFPDTRPIVLKPPQRDQRQ